MQTNYHTNEVSEMIERKKSVARILLMPLLVALISFACIACSHAERVIQTQTQDGITAELYAAGDSAGGPQVYSLHLKNTLNKAVSVKASLLIKSKSGEEKKVIEQAMFPGATSTVAIDQSATEVTLLSVYAQ